MDRSQKEKAVADFKKIFDEAEAVIVTHYKGINADSINELRSQTRDSNVSFRVTKNRLIKIALEGGVYENISDLFTGPTAVAFSSDAIISARILSKFSKDNENLKLLGGIMGNEVLDQVGVQNVANLPTLDEARAKIVGILTTPASKFVSILLARSEKMSNLSAENSEKTT